MLNASGLIRYGLVTAVTASAFVSLSQQAVHAEESRTVQVRSVPTFIAGEKQTFETCWRGGAGQDVILKYRSGSTWIQLSRTRLQAVPGGCAKGYPLRAMFQFTAPQTPSTYSFREELLKKGKLPGATSAPYRVVVRQASEWTSDQQTCVDIIFHGDPNLGLITQQGPDRAPAATVKLVNDCVQRNRTLTLEYVNAWLSAYGLPASDIPDAHRDLVMGLVTPDGFVNQVVIAAQNRYAGIASMITRERSTATVLNAYGKLVQDALETSITNPIADPLLGPWLTTSLPATLRDAERALRQDPRYNYTRRAHLEATILGSEIICAFGGPCDRWAIEQSKRQLAAMPALVPRWPLF